MNTITRLFAAAAASLVLAAALVVAPSAVADGLASCREDPVALGFEANQALLLIAVKTTISQYETPSTVLQYVDKTLSGVGPDVKTPCAPIMAAYVTGRLNGTINAPTGPGSLPDEPQTGVTTEPNPTPKHVGPSGWQTYPHGGGHVPPVFFVVPRKGVRTLKGIFWRLVGHTVQNANQPECIGVAGERNDR
jgi:hypothetical protein